MSVMPAGTGASIELPWGGGEGLVLELPPYWAGAEVVWPDLAGVIADYPDALRRALDAPEGAARLEEQVVPGQKVAIVVDDPSRWTPVRAVLPVVLERLHARGIRPGDVTISVGVGRHHAVDARAMRKRVGDAIAEAYRCFSPPVDDRAAYRELGTTPEGVPVRIFRPVAEADLRILIGSVLPHLQAGFGGGYKLILPGTSHRTTLGALHRQGLGRGCDAGRLLGGAAAENPMRRAIAAAAGLLGPVLLDQPPARRGGAGLRGAGRASCSGAGPARGRGPAAVRGSRGRGGRPGRRGQSSLAGRPDAELQGPVAAPRGVPQGGRPRRLLLDRARGDRPLVPARIAPRDRGHRRRWGLGGPPRPGAGRPGGGGYGQPRRVHDPLRRASWSSIGRSWSTRLRFTPGSAPASGRCASSPTRPASGAPRPRHSPSPARPRLAMPPRSASSPRAG